MICWKCGKKNKDDSRFCTECGAVLEIEKDITENNATGNENENLKIPANSGEGYGTRENSAEKENSGTKSANVDSAKTIEETGEKSIKKNRKILWISAISILVVAIAVIVIVIISKSGNDSDEEKNGNNASAEGEPVENVADITGKPSEENENIPEKSVMITPSLIVYDKQISETETLHVLYDVNEKNELYSGKSYKFESAMYCNEGLVCCYGDFISILDLKNPGTSPILIDEGSNFLVSKDGTKILYEKIVGEDEISQYNGEILIKKYFVKKLSLFCYDIMKKEKYSIEDDKTYFMRKIYSSGYSSYDVNFLITKDFEKIYFYDVNDNLYEWDKENGSILIATNISFLKRIHQYDEKVRLSDDDILYYAKEGENGECIYAKKKNSNPKLIIENPYDIFSYSNGDMYIEKKYNIRAWNYPVYLTEKEFEEYKAQIDIMDWMDVELTYQLIDIENLYDYEKYIDSFPELKEEKRLYIVSDDVGKTSRLLIEAAFATIGYDVEKDPKNQGRLRYITGSEIYYYNEKKDETKLIYKTDTNVDYLSGIPIAIIGDVGYAVRDILILPDKNQDIDVGNIKHKNNYIVNKGGKIFFYWYGDEKSYRFVIEGVEKEYETPQYHIEELSDYDANKTIWIIMNTGNTFSYDKNKTTEIYYDPEGFSKYFYYGADLYYNDLMIDNDVLVGNGDTLFAFDIDKDEILYIKRIVNEEYEVSEYNDNHKRALMLYKDGATKLIAQGQPWNRYCKYGIVEDKVLYMSEWDEQSYTGKLHLYDDSGDIVIDENVEDVYKLKS